MKDTAWIENLQGPHGRIGPAGLHGGRNEGQPGDPRSSRFQRALRNGRPVVRTVLMTTALAWSVGVVRVPAGEAGAPARSLARAGSATATTMATRPGMGQGPLAGLAPFDFLPGTDANGQA